MIDLKEAMEELRDEVIQRHIDAGQKASGRTIASFKIVEVAYNHMQLWGLPHSYTLEFGRKGGDVPNNIREIIYQWSLSKGLSFSNDNDRMRFAYFVSEKIRREGTLLYRSGQTKDIFRTPINKLRDKIKKNLLADQKQTILDTIYKR